MRDRTSSPGAVPGLEAHLGYWLRRVSNHVSGSFARLLHARQVSVAEWVALRLIRDRKDMTPGMLAGTLGLTRGAVSKVLEKLERRKWIERAIKADDNRVQLLSLTPQGRRVLPELAKIADSNDGHFFGCLDDDEQATLRRLLQKLADVHELTRAPLD